MPLALCTALQLSAVIFQQDIDAPIMYITPETVTTEATVFLVYTSAGKGHYDAAIATHHLSKLDKFKANSCRCGINKKLGSGISCKPTPFYNTRSKCFKESRPCTPQCHCINCANPHGQRLHIPNIHERTRRKHKLQENIPSSKHFAQERGEKLSEAVWFTFESLVLHEVCALLKKADIHIITKTYTDIVSYCISLFCAATLPKVVFRSKTVSQVQSKINYTEKNLGDQRRL